MIGNQLALTVTLAIFGALALSLRGVRERLSSMRVGVVLLAVVASLSTVGVLIGQGLPEASYSERFGPALGRFVVNSGLSSVFVTWYFLLSVWTLTLSVASCTFRRILRLARSVEGGRRAPAAVGSLVTHFSLMLIVAGGLVTALTGFRRVDSRFLGSGDTSHVPEGDFTLEVLEARTEFSEGGKLSEYVSVVRVLEDGESAGIHRIEVNHPLTVNGVGVYQYEMLPSPESVESVLLAVTLNPPEGLGDPFELRAPFREETPIDGTSLSVKALEFLSDFTYDIDAGTAGLRSIWHDNPAVLLQVSAAGERIFERWVFLGPRGHEDDQDLPCRLFLLDYEPDFQNGLTRFEYSRQPGTPILFAGLAALSAGMCAIFWTRMRWRYEG